MIATLFVTLIVAAETQAATAPAAGSPERAYAEFTAAVRAGKVDDAIKLSTPVGAANRAFFAAQYRMLHEIESLKAATLKRFPGEDAEMAVANSGMVSPADVATAQATVVGDDATITMVAPDSRQRESTSINLVRVGGRWLVSPFDAAATGMSDEEEKEQLADAAKLARETGEYEAIAKLIAALRPRLDKGEFADADAVMRAALAAAVMR